MAGLDYDVLVCAESKVSDRCHLSKLHNPDFGCPQQRLRNSPPGAQGMALYVREGFRSIQQSKLEGSCHESCVFRISSRINNFYVYALYFNPGHDGSVYDCILDSMARVQSVDDKAVFVLVGDANSHHSEWLESVSHTDRHGLDALDFCNQSGCEQLVPCPNHIAGNRLDLVMTDVPDIVNVVVGTPLETFDHCFVSCVLRIEQCVPEYNIKSTVFLKHRRNWDNVRCVIRRFTWSTILKLADPLDAFDRAIGEVRSLVGLFLPLFCVLNLKTSNGLMQAAGELMMLSRLPIMLGVEHAVPILGSICACSC